MVLGEPQYLEQVLRELQSLKRGSSICPGQLARKVLPGVEEPLRLLRPLIYRWAEQGHLRLSQKGHILPWWKIRGPFRILPK